MFNIMGWIYNMIWMKIGICFSLLSVIIGAFGAHGIKDSLIKNNTVEVFNTSVKYHIFHITKWIWHY